MLYILYIVEKISVTTLQTRNRFIDAGLCVILVALQERYTLQKSRYKQKKSYCGNHPTAQQGGRG
jgi:hypothetical protein